MNKMGSYYRASMAVLQVGENAGPKAYDYSDDPERQRLEDFLERKRPAEACSRLKSWFVCDTPANSARYLEAELTRRKNPEDAVRPKLYAVEFDTFSRQPMILVNAANNALLENDAATAKILAAEYWRPTMVWKFWEYTTPEIQVVQEVEWPDTIAQSLALMAYQRDQWRLQQMLGRR